MRRTDALKRTLTSLASVYNDGERVSVDFGKPSRAEPGGNVYVDVNVRDALGRDLEGAQELRLIANTLSHEVEHLRESDLTDKEEFMGEYEHHSQLAGAIINILEDQYIDHQRTLRYPGLRKAQAFYVDAIMENHHRRPRVDNMDRPAEQVQESILQIAFAGYAKGISEASDELRQLLADVRPLIRAARYEDDQEARKNLAHDVMDLVTEYLPDDADIDMPDKCVACEERPPVVIVPLLGPLCKRCAPGGHGGGGSGGSGERPEPDERERQPPRPEPDDGEGEGPGEGEGDDDGPGDGEGNGDGDGPDDGEGDEPGGPGGDEPGQDDGEGDGPGGGSGGDDEREIDPREWDWLDLGDHEDHTVALVDDDAEV